MFARTERFRERPSDVPSSTIGQLDWSENDRGTSIHRAERFGESGPNAGPDLSHTGSDLLLTAVSDGSSDRASDSGEATVEPQQNSQGRGSDRFQAAKETANLVKLKKEVRLLKQTTSTQDRELIWVKKENKRLEEKLQATAKNNAKLVSERAGLRKEKWDLVRGKQILQDKVDLAESEPKQTSMTPSQLQAQINLAERKVTIRNKEIETLRKHLSNSEARVQGSVRQERDALNGMELELNRYIEQVGQLKQEVQGKNDHLEEVQRVLSTEKAAKKSAEDELSQKLENIQLLESKIEDLGQTLQFTEEESGAQKEVNGILQSKVKDTEERLARLEEQLADMARRSEVTQGELEQQRSVRGDLETKCAMLEASLTATENALTSSSTACKDLQEKLSLSEKTKARLEAKVSGQLERIGKLEEYKKTSMVNLSQLKEEVVSERQAKKIVEENVLLESKRASKLEGEIRKLEALVERHKDETASERDAKKELQTSLSNLKEENSLWKGRVKAGEEALKKSQEHVKQLQGKIVNLEGCLKTSKQTLASEEQENASLQRSLKELENKIQHFSSSNLSSQKEASIAKAALSDLQSEHQNCMASFADKCACYEKEIAIQKTVLQEKQKVFQSSLEQLRQDHQAALESLTQKCLTLEDELAHQKSASAEEKSVLVSNVQGLEETVDKQNSEIETFSKMQADMVERIKELEKENTMLREDNERLQSAYDKIEERYRPYQDQIDGLEDLNHFLRNQTSSAQTEAQKLGDQYARLLGHQNQKQKIHYVKKIKDENVSMKQDIVKLNAEITRHKRTIARMEEENAGTKSVRKAITPDPSRLQQALKTKN